MRMRRFFLSAAAPEEQMIGICGREENTCSFWLKQASANAESDGLCGLCRHLPIGGAGNDWK